jgi:2,3-bisphosphoglycerate-dependent phosphoglycerate mutase
MYFEIQDWRLNERNYGALVGRNKKQAVEEFGKEQVKLWRRSWDVPPPPMSSNSPHWPGKDPRYETLGIDVNCIPPSESLADVTKRTKLFWEEVIVRDLKKHKKVALLDILH